MSLPAVLLVWALAAVFATPAAAAGSQLYPLPLATHGFALTVGPDRTVWFSGRHGSRHESGAGDFVGRLAPDGTVSEFTLPYKGRAGTPISGAEGDVWFPMIYEDERGHAIPRIGHISSAGQLQEYSLGSEEGRVSSVAMLNGDLWFAVARGGDSGVRSAVGRIATSSDGSVQEFALGPACYAGAITAAGGDIWFTESCQPRPPSGRVRPSGRIGRIDPAGQIVRHSLPARVSPISITAAPRGTIWFGASGHESWNPKIGRITPGGDLVVYPAPTGWLMSIAVGADNRLWFPSSFGGASFRALRSIGERGRLSKPICVVPRCRLEADGLAAGPDGRLWFSASRPSYVGGGGMTQMIYDEQVANEAGAIGSMAP